MTGENIFGAETFSPEVEELAAPPVMLDGSTITTLGNGDLEVLLDGVLPQLSPTEGDDHDANLADRLEESQLSQLAQDVSEWVKADESARSEWKQIFERGLEQLGIASTPLANMVFKNASQLNHPLVMEAVIQFQARAMEELFPAAGPAKGQVLGDRTDELDAQAMRVQDYINYHLTVLDKGYFEDSDQMLFVLGSSGSVFRKVFNDGKMCKARFVNAEDGLVPYSAKTLDDTPRFTHRFTEQRSSIERAQAKGTYRAVDLGSAVTPTQEGSQETKDHSDNRSPSYAQEDDVRTLWECYCERDLEDFGEPRPYIVTVDKDTLKVLAVRRNWRKDDPEMARRQWFVHYKLLPGFGFYGHGFIHLLGQLGAAATGLLRIIIDGGARANFGGGWRTKEAGKAAGTRSPGLGEFIDVDLTAEEVQKGFHDLPFKEPGPGAYNALTRAEDGGRRLGSTTELAVGDSTNTGPVGTTIALLDQAMKVPTGIHKRLHNTLGQELAMFADLVGDSMTDEGYPYHVGGASKQVMASDFDSRVDVVPVSDPSIVSSTQRLTQAQTALQLVGSSPGLYNLKAQREVHKRMWQAMKMPEFEKILLPESQLRHDPITENTLLLSGGACKAFIDQQHEAHIIVHKQFFGTLPPDLQQQLAPAMMAHLAEHVGLQYRVQMMQQLGAPLPPADEDGVYPELAPELEAQLSVAAAQMAMQGQQGLPQGQQPGQPQPQQGQPQGPPQGAQPGQPGGMPPELQDMVAQLQAGKAELEQQREALLAERNALAAEKIQDKITLGVEKLQALGQTISAQVEAKRDALANPDGIKADIALLVQTLTQTLAGPRQGVVQRDGANRIAGWQSGPAQ